MVRHRKRHGGYLGRGGGNGVQPAPSPSLYSSGSQYGTVVSGSPQSQFSRTFENGPTSGMGQSNALTGVQGQLSVRAPQNGGSRKRKGGLLGPLIPVLNQAALPLSVLAMQQTYGRKDRNAYKHGGSKKKRGGLFGPVLNQAIVPFGVLAMQQTYGRKKNNNSKKRTFRRKSYRKY